MDLILRMDVGLERRSAIIIITKKTNDMNIQERLEELRTELSTGRHAFKF